MKMSPILKLAGFIVLLELPEVSNSVVIRDSQAHHCFSRSIHGWHKASTKPLLLERCGFHPEALNRFRCIHANEPGGLPK
jgi:hypothetical protein